MGKEHEPMLSLYSNLMNEVKWRLHAIPIINEELGRSLKSVQRMIAIELYWLQLRMICETIALACMVAHGNIDGADKGTIRTAYKPKVLLGGLESLHHDFYPKPWEFMVTSVVDGGTQFHGEITSGFLTKSELIKLWNKCGDILHRGRPATLEIKRNAELGLGANEIGEYAQKIMRLLNLHTISRHNSTSLIACMMEPEPLSIYMDRGR